MPGWNYRASGYYFVTICTKDRMPFLGEVVEGETKLSVEGEIVASEWMRIGLRKKVGLDEWMIMPNHVHGIIVIDDDDSRTARTSVETPQGNGDSVSHSTEFAESARHRSTVNSRGVSTSSRLLPGSLGAIIGQFKSRSTKRIWAAAYRDFGWQARYYDHVIRTEDSLYELRKYIRENPVKWEFEKDNPENLNM